jgi:hypothetical protein
LVVEMEGAPVVFKKRANKGSVRRKEQEPEDGAAEEQEEIDSTMLQDIKFQQTMRAKKGGSSTEALIKPAALRATGEVVEEEEEGDKTIESMMGTQYTVQVENGIQNVVPHKKLMDKYIDEQLGLTTQKK